MTLLPGDILLWRVDPSASWVDRLVGWGERVTGQPSQGGAQYFHVGFVSGDPVQFYESKPPRICLSYVPEPLPSFLEAYRLRVAPTQDQLEAIMAYADSRVGKFYNFLGVLSGGMIELGGLEFCSQYTDDAFTYGGIVLVPNQPLLSPDDIAASRLLMPVAR